MIRTVREQTSQYALWMEMSLAAIILAALFFSLRVLAAPSVHKAGNAKEGAVLFQKYCVSCHNKEAGDTMPFGPPNLHGIFAKKPPTITPREAEDIIAHGKGVMPGFSNQLEPASIENLLAYLKTQ
jgi:mono/diheme cytochrome c family protein